jgi:hypothetical protein
MPIWFILCYLGGFTLCCIGFTLCCVGGFTLCCLGFNLCCVGGFTLCCLGLNLCFVGGFILCCLGFTLCYALAGLLCAALVAPYAALVSPWQVRAVRVTAGCSATEAAAATSGHVAAVNFDDLTCPAPEETTLGVGVAVAHDVG